MKDEWMEAFDERSATSAINALQNRKPPHGLIDAFAWDQTPEGFDYWNLISQGSRNPDEAIAKLENMIRGYHLPRPTTR